MAGVRIRNITGTETTAQSGDYLELDRVGYTQTKKITLDNLTLLERTARIAQDDVIEAAGGLKTDGTYGVAETTSTNTWYLRAADFANGTADRSGEVHNLTPSLKSADRLLDGKLYEVEQRLVLVENSQVYVEAVLTHQDLRNLNNTPIKVLTIAGLPNYSAGMAFVLTGFEWQFTGTVPYNTNTNLTLYTNSTTFYQGTSGYAMLSTANRSGKGTVNDDSILTGSTGDTQLVADADLYVSEPTGDAGGGAGGQTLKLFIHGVLIDLS